VIAVRAIERSPNNHFRSVRGTVGAPGSGEVVLAVRSAGLCGTDIQIVRGLRRENATVLGHEALCCVVSVGDRRRRQFAVGDAVMLNPTSSDDPGFLLGHSMEGVFRSHLVVSDHTIDLGQVVPVPPTIERDVAVLVEPLACALYAWSVVRPFAPERVVVVGDGTVGQLATLLASEEVGPEAVYLASRADWRSDSRRAELEHALGGRTAVLVATPRDSTGGCVHHVLAHLDDRSVVDVIGGVDPRGDSLLSRVAEVRATNVCGLPAAPRTLELDLGHPGRRRRVHVTGHRGVSGGHLRASARLLAQAPHRFRGLVTHVVDVNRAVGVLNELAATGNRTLDGRRIVKLAIDFEAGGDQ
jgi:threonine dehydrogenase-like Zn-dependent dehydrogenase